MAQMQSPRYNETIRQISELRTRCRVDDLTAADFTNEITDLFYDYLGDEDPRDDVLSLVDFCVDVARQVCDLDHFSDRILPLRLENQLRWILEQQGDGQTVANLARGLRARLAADDEQARIELVELCQRGYDTHQAMFSAVDSEREILELAYEYSVVAALDAAVRPTSPGRLANEDKSRGLALPRVLDFLGHLAADPIATSGSLARDALVGLCAYPETSGAAAVRLPVHLLSSMQRDNLREIYVAHEDSMDGDIVRIFITDQQLRDREILRSALWQANDATQITPSENHSAR